VPRSTCPVAVWVHSKQASYGGLLQSHLIQGRASKTRSHLFSGVLREKVPSTRVSEGRREGEGRGGGGEGASSTNFSPINLLITSPHYMQECNLVYATLMFDFPGTPHTPTITEPYSSP
jgi:hypothetical protein